MYNLTIDEKIRLTAQSAYCSIPALTDTSLAELTEKALLESEPSIFSDIEAAKKFFNENRDSKGNFKYLELTDDGFLPERDVTHLFDTVTSIVKMDFEKFIAYPEVPVEVKQDEIPAFEETPEQVEQTSIEVSGDTTNNFAQIDLGTGIVFDPEKINSEMGQNFDPTNPARFHLTPDQNMISQPMIQQPMMPQPMMQPVQMMPSVPQMIPQQMAQQPMIPQVHIPVIHKVDEPPKPPKAVPAEDKIDMNLDNINIDGLKKPPVVKETPAYISPMPQATATAEEPVNNRYDNSGIISRFPKVPLFQIQSIANIYGCSVRMEEYPHQGLISVMAVDHRNWQFVPAKSFVIDSGMIIDKRAKLIGTNPVFNQSIMLEQAPMYELFVVDAKNHGRKILDEKMIHDIFMAGMINVSKKEMYTEQYKALNMKLALISLPTKGLNKEERNALQDYIIKMDNDGFLDSAIKMAPNSRFVFMEKQLDKDHLSDFTLVNQGVPKFYGTQPFQVVPVIIQSKDGQISIKSGSEVQA